MASLLQRIILLLIFFAGNTVAGQVKFNASVSPAQIGKDEYAQLRFTVENGRQVDHINPPSLKDFIIVSGPSQENSTSVMNGVMRTSMSLAYVIKPRSAGTFSIPSATAVVNGVTYTSKPVTLKVSNSLSGNSNAQNNTFIQPFSMPDPFTEPATETPYNDYILRKGENAGEKVKRNMLVKVEVNKNSCYVGEPVIATYKLYTRLKSESSVTQNPSFNGFSVVDIQAPNNMNYTRERLNGREYNVYTIRKVQLYPLQPGTLDLESIEIENKVRFIKEEYARRRNDTYWDVFREFTEADIPAEGLQDHVETLQSKALTVLVKPLPEAGKPAGFRGAVGNYTLIGGLEKNNFSTDDAGKLQVVLSGEGNLQLVTSPEIKWPKGLDPFEPKVTEDISKTTVPVSGKKLIEYPFTVAQAGNYTLPPVEFSFFDPVAGKYKTAAIPASSFTVTQGTGRPSKDTLAIIDQQNNRGFLQKLFSNRRLVVSIVAVLILCGLIIWLKRDNKKAKQEKELAVQKEQEQRALVEEPVEDIISNQAPLEEAESYLAANDRTAFYSSLNQAFKNFLSHKLRIPVEELNKKTINEQMDKKGITIDTSLQVQQLLDEIEWELYTPFADTSRMQQAYDKVNALIQLLNTYKV